LDEEKSKCAGFAQENSFSTAYLLCLLRLVKKPSKSLHLLEKSVINMIALSLHVFDWPIIMIGPGGLLLIVPTYLQFHFQFYG
jgi:hypothetical protein